MCLLKHETHSPRPPPARSRENTPAARPTISPTIPKRIALTKGFLGAVCVGTIKVNWPAPDSGEDRHVDAFVRSPRQTRNNSTGQVTFLPRRKLSLFPLDRRWGLPGWIHRMRR